MSWQRKIPFGYQIQNGKAVPQPDEANAGRRIFGRYLGGDSYLVIAAAMSGDGVLKIADAELERRVTALLNRLISQPGLPDMPPAAAPLSLESERTQNELYRELGKTDWNEDYAKSLALACAAERYEALGNRNLIIQKTAGLGARLSGMAPLTAFDGGLFHEAADALMVGADGALALKLIGGGLIAENESGEVEHHADTACPAENCHRDARGHC